MSTNFFFSIIIIIIIISTSLSQPLPNDAPSPSAEPCNGIFLSYTYTGGEKLPPILKSDPNRQPYRFESFLTVLNNGLEDLKSWRVFIGFQHNEYLVSASNAVLADGTTIPGSVGNGTVFAGYPMSDLKTAIETAGDYTQILVRVKLVGTQFGVASPAVPMPLNISLLNDGFACPKPTMPGKNEMQVCCKTDPTIKANITTSEEFLPRQTSDLTIMYDVLRTYDSSYWAQVTISNHNSLSRLDNWKLSWDWMRGEFIFLMKGAYPSVVDASDCIFGSQSIYYQNLDFSTVLNCERRPTIVDLPLTKANDSVLGFVPFCCRDGVILPPQMDPSKSISSFQLQVFKMPPDLNRSVITPPQNWRINGSLNPNYKCGPPIRVSPTQFPDPSGLPTNKTAVSSWQIVCNITKPEGTKTSPKCCVSFSAYYNESVVPCRTCACGCAGNAGPDHNCSTTAAAMLLPSDALLVPFENRSAPAVAWAAIKHLPIYNPMPCGDNCGLSINWHLYTDYRSGWSARITLFNWEDINFADWFVAVEMDKAGPGFQATYSFNGTSMVLNGENNTIFMQGLPGLNYLVREVDGADPVKNPRVPGKQQSVISFNKKYTPGIDVTGGDGFPSKVFFNGEECLLPTVFPTSGSEKGLAYHSLSILLIVILVASLLIQ